MQNFANFQIVRVEDFLSTSVAKRINNKSIDLLTLRSFAAIIIASRRSQNSHELVHNFQFVSYQSFFVLQFNWMRQQFIGYVYQPWQPPPEFFALISDTPQGCLINEMKSQILDCSTIEISLENGSWWIERSFTRIILFYSFIRFFRFRFEEINVNKSLHIVTVWDLMRYRHLKFSQQDCIQNNWKSSLRTACDSQCKSSRINAETINKTDSSWNPVFTFSCFRSFYLFNKLEELRNLYAETIQ